MSNVIINDVEVHLVSRDGSIFASSLEVASVFEKGHDDVLKKIRSFSERGLRNFTESFYMNSQNKRQPMYEMNRDGFMFLGMGFNGEKAENFKLDLIDAFNEMEKQIYAPKVLTVQEQIALIAQGNQIIDDRVTLLEQTKRLEAWQERSLSDAKNKKVYSFNPSDGENTSKLHRAVWSKFKRNFNLPRYNELPAVKYQQGLLFINNLTLIDLV